MSEEALMPEKKLIQSVQIIEKSKSGTTMTAYKLTPTAEQQLTTNGAQLKPNKAGERGMSEQGQAKLPEPKARDYKAEYEAKRARDAVFKAKYPTCFALMHPEEMPRPHWAIAYGMDIGPGWLGIMDELCVWLERVLATEPVCPVDGIRPHIVQVKEKFGGLRVYLSHTNTKAEALIGAAEVKASMTCEECGETGKLRSGGWLQTMCDGCQTRGDER